MSVNKYIFKDEDGMPVLFTAKKKEIDESSTELVTPDATSGPAEWGRYHDAVREAARSFDHPEEGDIQHFLNARAKHPANVDTPAFHEAVKRQRMADLVDMVDHHMRREGSLSRGHRMVRVQAPKGFVRQSLRKSSPEDLAHLRHRLNSVGHNSEHVDKYLSARVSPDMWDQASALEVKFSDDEQFSGMIALAASDDDEFQDMWDLEEYRPEIHIHIDRESLDQ